ncbi:MAG: protocatechuate 3,4-dioxygenase [Verrucomicrobiota bacterium]
MKNPHCPLCHRRKFLHLATLGSAALFTTPGAFAEALTLTPRQTEGPFYPDKLPLDTDNDLILINDSITPAVGEITHLTGTVRDVKGDPVRNTLVEIWQADSNGSYLHSKGAARERGREENFQGYGRFLTDSKGRYYFRTIKPVAYGRRTPHIHFAVTNQKQERLLTTQLYTKGEPLNKTDSLLNRVEDPELQALIIVPYKPFKNSDAGELTAHFDIVIGQTPEDPADDAGRNRQPRGNFRPQSGNE